MLSINSIQTTKSKFSVFNFNADKNIQNTNNQDFQYSLASSNALKSYALASLSFGNNSEPNLTSVLRNFKALLTQTHSYSPKITIKTMGQPNYEIQIRKSYGSPTELNTSCDNDVAVIVNPGRQYAVLHQADNGQVILKSFATLNDNQDYPSSIDPENTTSIKNNILTALKQFDSGQYASIEGFMGVFIDHGIKPTEKTTDAISKVFNRIKTVYASEDGINRTYTGKDLPYDGLKLVLNDGRILHVRNTILPQPEIFNSSDGNYIQLSVYPYLGSRKPDLTSVIYVNSDDPSRFGTIVQAGSPNENVDILIDRDKALPQLEKILNEISATKYLSPIIGVNDLYTIDYNNFDGLKQLFNKIRPEAGKFEESERKAIELSVSGIIARFKSVKVSWPGNNDSLRYHEAPSSRLELEFVSSEGKPNVQLTINTAGQIIKSNAAQQFSQSLVNRLLSQISNVTEVR